MEQSDPHLYDRSPSGVYHPHLIPSPSSGGGRCNDACAVIAVLLVVFFVVIIVGAIVVEAQKNDRIEKESWQERTPLPNDWPRTPRPRFSSYATAKTKRSIWMRKDPLNPVKTIMIEVLDKNQKARTFKAEMRGKAST